ncbi:MAG: intradiol ring-cleavage dioxygenase, partial [Acidobacteriia bacterium 12-62-4]
MACRRHFLAALFSSPGLFAEQLTLTPRQTEGPFYPDHLPLDTDNDLLVLNKSLTPATGEVTYLSGRILDGRGEPIRNAQVEIWQVDNNGAYIHSRSGNTARRDPNFQGFGRFLTGSTGEYLFRTIKPVPYPGRTRHIHMAVQPPVGQRLVTQVYVAGEPGNDRDMVLRGIRDALARASVIVPFAPLPGSQIGERTARFDVVMG